LKLDRGIAKWLPDEASAASAIKRSEQHIITTAGAQHHKKVAPIASAAWIYYFKLGQNPAFASRFGDPKSAIASVLWTE
jgi:hypothetical protein